MEQMSLFNSINEGNSANQEELDTLFDNKELGDKDLSEEDIESTIECSDVTGIDSPEKFKAIRLKTNEYIFDAGSLLLPFIADYRGDKVITLEVIQNNSTIRVKSSTYGVPTLYDKTVLMAIQKLFVQQRLDNKTLTLNRKDITREERTMKPVTLREIYKAMGYDVNPTSYQLKKISESIERINETTYIICGDRLYDHKDNKYIIKGNAKKGIHLLEYEKVDYTLEELEERKKHASRIGTNEKNKKKYLKNKEEMIDGRVQITLSELVYQALASDQLVYYNDPTVMNIKNTLAKHIFVLALKWAGSKKEVKIGMKTLLTYIPMKKGKKLSSQKTMLRNAVEYLNTNGVCTAYELNNDIFYFCFKKAKEEKLPENVEHDYLKGKFNTIQELNQGFIDLGFEDGFCYTLELTKMEYYKAMVRYITIKNGYGAINDTKAYTIDFMKKNRDVEKKYYN